MSREREAERASRNYRNQQEAGEFKLAEIGRFRAFRSV
jgi:hypothetical protein